MSYVAIIYTNFNHHTRKVTRLKAVIVQILYCIDSDHNAAGHTMKGTILGLLVAVVVVSTVVAEDVREEEVQVSGGLVRGKLKRSEGGKEYMAYHAIPYALPPINKTRFMVTIMFMFFSLHLSFMFIAFFSL